MNDKKVFVIFSFGSKGTRGSHCLGVSGLTKREDILAVITQMDVPNLAVNINNKRHGFCPFFYVEEFMRDDGWHSTLWVANAAKKFCEWNEFPLNAVVIAAPMHLKRAMRDTRMAGFSVVRGKSPLIKTWYERESLLPWTRSWWRWWPREIMLRMLPWYFYKKLTLG